MQPLPLHHVSWMHATSTSLSANASINPLALPVSESTFQIPTQNFQPLCSLSVLRSSWTQPFALTQSCAAFSLGFPTSSLWRRGGAHGVIHKNHIFICHLLGFMVQRDDNKGRHTHNPAGRHPVRTNLCPTSIILTVFTPDALPAATLPIYPGLEQAPSMLVCIPSGLVHTQRLVVLR